MPTKQVEVQGTVYEVPEAATLDQIGEYLKSKGVKPKAPTVTKPPESTTSKVVGAIGDFTDFTLGAGKRVVEQGHNISKAMDTLSGSRFVFPPDKKQEQQFDKFVQPKGDAQERGGKVVDLVEMFIPIPGLAEMELPRALQFLPKGLLGKVGMGAIKAGFNAAKSATDIGIKTYVQTGNWDETKKAMLAAGVTEGVVAVAKPLIIAASRGAYRAALKLPKYIKPQAMEGVIDRGLSEGIAMSEKGAEKVNKLLTKDIGERDLLTKGKDGKYAMATIDARPIIKEWKALALGRDSFGKPLPVTSSSSYRAMMDQITEWEHSLSGTLRHGQNKTGKWVARTNPVPKGPLMVTGEELQLFKESLSKNFLKESTMAGKKEAESSAQQNIARKVEQDLRIRMLDITNKEVDPVNKAIQQDMYLRGAIQDAMVKNPSWVNDWAIFAMGASLEHLMAAGMGKEVIAGALVRTMVRSPKVLSRIAISLNKLGYKLPWLGQAAVKAGTVLTRPGQNSNAVQSGQ